MKTSRHHGLVRSLAPDLVRGDFNTMWIYITGPILGALVAVCFEWILKGKPTAAGAIAAQGTYHQGNEGIVRRQNDDQ